jgi:hypothetical protein
MTIASLWPLFDFADLGIEKNQYVESLNYRVTKKSRSKGSQGEMASLVSACKSSMLTLGLPESSSVDFLVL